MAKEAPSSLFVNDGSFMERFKQLQQESGKEKEKAASSLEESKPPKVITGASLVKPSASSVSKTSLGFKPKVSSSGGKLAFSLKQKSKLVAPAVNLAADDEEEDEKDAGKRSDDAPSKRQKLGQSVTYEQRSAAVCGVPPPPSDPTVKNVADKLASFVAKHGRQFEHVTRQKNPGDTPFKFLFDESCADYKYYRYQLAEEEKALVQDKEFQNPNNSGTSTSASKSSNGLQRPVPKQSGFQTPVQKQSSFQTPASALYTSVEDSTASVERNDPVAMMEFYMKKAAQEEKRKQPKQSKDEMPPPASLQVGGPGGKRGHHMGDYIPPEELEKFLATCNDAAARKNVREYMEKTKIQSDNVGHKLLSKMGWKEGKGLGSSSNGIADPIMAGEVKKNNLGVGAQQPGEVTAEDDIYEQYKKRMMLGYKYRPNPLNNPRKAYY